MVGGLWENNYLIHNFEGISYKNNSCMHGCYAVFFHISKKPLYLLWRYNNYKIGNIMRNAIYRGDLSSVDLLLSSGVDVNARFALGLTGLMFAIMRGKNQIVDRLMAVDGIDVNAKSLKGFTALMMVAENNKVDFLHKLLLVNGININAASNDGYTALMFASQNGHVEVIVRLLEVSSIDVNAASNDGYTALMLAVKYGCLEVVNQLLEVDGIDVNAKSSDGSAALNLALQYGHIDVAERLMLQNGVDLGSSGQYGYTPLMLAAKVGEDGLVKFLLARGVDVNARNSEGCTALILAAANNYLKVVEQLLAVGSIDVDAANSFGFTALMFAAQDGFADMVRQLLLVKGINLNVRDEDGNTALMLAAKYGYIDIVRMLVSRLEPADVILNDGQGINAYSLVSTGYIKKYLIYSGKLLFGNFGSPSRVVIPAWAFFGPGAAIFNQGALSIRTRFLALRVCGLEFPEAGTSSNVGMIIEKFKVIGALMRSAVLAKVLGRGNSYFFMHALFLRDDQVSSFKNMAFELKNNIAGFLGEGDLGCISPWIDAVQKDALKPLSGAVRSREAAEVGGIARPAKAARK